MRSFDPCLWLNELPVLSGSHELEGVKLSETELVTEGATNGGEFPIFVAGIDDLCCTDTKVLNVSPAKIGATIISQLKICEKLEVSYRA